MGRSIKRHAIGVVGAVVTLAGILMLVLPGPGILVILLGLSILASEFAWAKQKLDWVKKKAKRKDAEPAGDTALPDPSLPSQDDTAPREDYPDTR